MGYENLNLGIDLTLPTSGEENWGVTLKNTTWTKISRHDHTGGGEGAPLPPGSLAADAVVSSNLAPNIALTQAPTLTPAGTTETLDFANGNIQKVDLGSATGDVTFTLSNPSAGAEYLIFLVQGATSRAVIWPGNVKWPQGQEAILSTTNGNVDYCKMYYDGTDFLCLGWDQNIS